MMLVAAAGPAMNFFLAWLAGLLVHPVELWGTLLSPDSLGIAYRFIGLCILANLVLGLFNLLPIPPLDGGRIVTGLLPRSLALPYMRLERWGILLVLFGVFLLPRLTDGFDPVGWALNGVVARAFDLVLFLSGNGGGA
jgi:Zn-dependent protease